MVEVFLWCMRSGTRLGWVVVWFGEGLGGKEAWMAGFSVWKSETVSMMDDAW